MESAVLTLAAQSDWLRQPLLAEVCQDGLGQSSMRWDAGLLVAKLKKYTHTHTHNPMRRCPRTRMAALTSTRGCAHVLLRLKRLSVSLFAVPPPGRPKRRVWGACSRSHSLPWPAPDCGLALPLNRTGWPRPSKRVRYQGVRQRLRWASTHWRPATARSRFWSMSSSSHHQRLQHRAIEGTSVSQGLLALKISLNSRILADRASAYDRLGPLACEWYHEPQCETYYYVVLRVL